MLGERYIDEMVAFSRQTADAFGLECTEDFVLGMMIGLKGFCSLNAGPMAGVLEQETKQRMVQFVEQVRRGEAMSVAESTRLIFNMHTVDNTVAAMREEVRDCLKGETDGEEKVS